MSIYASILYALLAALLIGLKLAGMLAWSWWWVMAPVWAPWVLAVAVLVWLGVTGLVVGLIRP